MNLNYYILFCILCTSTLLKAQTDSVSPEKRFSFIYDNDFFAATDRYYTQGVLLTLQHPVLRFSPLSKVLLKSKNSQHKHTVIIEQDVFTARSIRYMGGAVYKGERPFTALFFISQKLQSNNSDKRSILISQIDLGIIGPNALGEQEQKGIHKALNNIQPQGWQNQLNQDLMINYRVSYSKVVLGTPFFDCLLTGGGRLGTIYTDAFIGTDVRIGLLDNYFNAEEKKKNHLKVFMTLGASGKAVGYNATLQGGLISKNNIYELSDSEITRAVYQLSAFITLEYKKLVLGFGRYYLTPEFENGLEHSWGRCLIGARF
jgi:hypothetical protein